MRKITARAARAASLLAALAFAASCGTIADQQRAPDWDRSRDQMVDSQISGRGVTDERVLEAMRTVPRHLFVPEAHRAAAYEDRPLPIGFDQTISQPFIVAYMTELLAPKPTDRVLEIGSGSGYQAAVLAGLVREIYTIEVVQALAERARETLAGLGYTNVHVRSGDGYAGWPDGAAARRPLRRARPSPRL
jgi:protein-L-isoaspartate(D-aspartate) O-methyltransferase